MKNTIKSLNDYHSLYDSSMNDTNSFWTESASNYHWFKSWDSITSGNFKDLNIKWFEGAKTNLSYNCIDRHLKKSGNKTAVTWIDNDHTKEPIHITYQDLYDRVNTFSAILKSKNIKKGDRVCFYMGMVPELLVGILACTRI